MFGVEFCKKFISYWFSNKHIEPKNINSDDNIDSIEMMKMMVEEVEDKLNGVVVVVVEEV